MDTFIDSIQDHIHKPHKLNGLSNASSQQMLREEKSSPIHIMSLPCSSLVQQVFQDL